MAALAKISSTAALLNRLVKEGDMYHNAWNKCSVSLVKCAQAHMRYYICENFVKNVKSAETSQKVKYILEALCRLYLIYHIILNAGDFLKCGTLSSKNIERLQEEMGDLLATVRPQAVSIVDSFDIDDKILGSALGCWDGNVYQRLYDEALKSPLNKADVPQAYYKYLEPLMKSWMQAKL
ncbi:Acyl-coenzyme A oxidase (Acyl-CoA oxidase) [Halocaridina rubra]|uniref:Acyl-coenzyme A oxidase (Acyl-CoA oxidase) n=1 Tax=Halocaridina rubra TaxID=373956 RepID=A0AAN8WRZ2_HALRR